MIVKESISKMLPIKDLSKCYFFFDFYHTITSEDSEQSFEVLENSKNFNEEHKKV